MSDYIDPRTEPWDCETDDIWAWMRELWMANVSTISVPNTEANRIKEYREITQFWRQRHRQQNGHIFSQSQFLDWLQTAHKVDQPNRIGRPPRSCKQKPYDPFS